MGKKRMIGMAVAMMIVLIGILIVVYFMMAGRNKTKETSTTVTTQASNVTDAATTEVMQDDGATTAQDAVAETSVQSVCDQLLAQMGLEKSSPLDTHKICYFYKIDEAKVADSYGYISDVALADELVIMKAAEGTDVSELEAAANSRLEKQKDSFKDYIPEQAKRLDDARIVTQGNYVMYLVSDNADAIVQAFQEQYK